MHVAVVLHRVHARAVCVSSVRSVRGATYPSFEFKPRVMLLVSHALVAVCVAEQQ